MHKAIELLRFHPSWFEFGLLPETFFAQQLEKYRNQDDEDNLFWLSLEHHRYSAFRTILSTHQQLNDKQIGQYIELCALDEDEGMAHSALIDLLKWENLTDEQREKLARHSAFSDTHSQKIIWRNCIYEKMANGHIDDVLLAEILERQDSIIQRELVSHTDLTIEQIKTLSEQGSGRAIRNIARQRLEQKR